jgi:hypothetical protein
LNVFRVSVVRQIEIRIGENLVPEPSSLHVKIADVKLKNYESPGSYRIPEELIEAGGEKLRYEIHKLIKYVWNEEESPII